MLLYTGMADGAGVHTIFLECWLLRAQGQRFGPPTDLP